MTISLSQLVGKPVRTESGELVGHVREVRAKDHRVDTLICGASGFLQRLSGARTGRRVKWQQVLRVRSKEIICGDRLQRGPSKSGMP
jgi:sporulation protein YlmC with PRC-barrel domain